MNKSGLVSISFRQYSPEQILDAAANAGLELIEWGGDVHVPHGDVAKAREVAALTKQYGLDTAEYGSYYKIGRDDVNFTDVVRSADALETSVIRVWPGMNIITADLTSDDYAYMVRDAARICDEARNMSIALECHPDSLTEDYTSALKFINDVGRENLKMFWQPNQHKSIEYNVTAARTLSPYVVSVHTFFWEGSNRYPLADGADIWRKYINALQKKLPYMLEFMPDGLIETLPREAKTLHSIIKNK